MVLFVHISSFDMVWSSHNIFQVFYFSFLLVVLYEVTSALHIYSVCISSIHILPIHWFSSSAETFCHSNLREEECIEALRECWFVIYLYLVLFGFNTKWLRDICYNTFPSPFINEWNTHIIIALLLLLLLWNENHIFSSVFCVLFFIFFVVVNFALASCQLYGLNFTVVYLSDFSSL